MESTELMHYGVKGMKWGVRRAKKSSGGLTDRQIKKYAKKGYAQDSFRSNKTVAGKVWDAYTGAHKTMASAKYETSSKKQNRERAEKYLADKEKNRKPSTKKKLAKAAAKGAKATAGCLAKVGQAYVTDQLFFGGYGTAAAKEAIRGVGMATITAYTMARGGYDIKWFDKQGRRVG
jgi:hypothetical protein